MLVDERSRLACWPVSFGVVASPLPFGDAVCTRAISIVIADDNPVVLETLERLLETESGFAVVGRATGGNEAVELVRLLLPDVLVTDLRMPDLSGIEVCTKALACSPTTGVVIMSMESSDAYLAAALEAGARAYVPKTLVYEQLIEAIRESVPEHPHPLTPDDVNPGRLG